jgi:flagella basal body P-ring formation protein FlgA
MSVNPLTRCIFAAALSCGAQQAVAQQAVALQPLESIRGAAERALRAELPEIPGVELRAAALDSRLRLPACGSRLEAHATAPRGAQSRSLVRVACATGGTWSVNVPVEIRRELAVFVLRRAIARGDTVLAADVATQKRVVPGLAAPFITRLEDLNGRQTRRALTEGTALTADALLPALLIHRGQSVTLASGTGGIEVRAPGRALADASANQRLRVQNLDSLKVVEGVAESTGVVRVSP